ncbi:MAG: glycosyltransferase family 4 protein [Thermoplasmatota archaeon]
MSGEKLAIGEVCIRFGAPGGAEAHISAISRELARRGHRVVVFTSDLFAERPWKTGGPWEPVPPGVEVVRLPIKTKRPLIPLAMKGLHAALRRESLDILHAHSHRYHHTRVAADVARKAGIAFCMTPHYHPMEATDAAWKKAAARGLDAWDARRVYADAARVLLVTSREERILRDRGILRADARVRIIPNGIALQDWTAPRDPAAFHEGKGVGPSYVLYAGRLASNKGLPVLLRAWADLAPKVRAGTVLVLAGADWGVGAELAAQARALGIADEVRFVGHLSTGEYRSAIGGARVLVLPSEWEAFGIVLLEAMACGVPVVASAVGGVPDVVADGRDGLLVPYGDSAALSAAMGRLLSEPTLAREMGRAGMSKAAQYDWTRIVDHLESEMLAARAERAPR